MTKQIILASISPRRRELMKLLKIKFKAADSGYEEVNDSSVSHHKLVMSLALGKAKAAAKKYPKAIIVAADTLVSFRGKVLGKPKNNKEAFKFLKALSGKSHKVFSGAVVMDAASGKIIIGHDVTTVWIKKLSDKEIFEYLTFGEALDKAGGYGPLGKGLNLIEKITGDGTTQFGMPLVFVSNALISLSAKF